MATREQIIWADSEYRQRMFWRGFRRKAVALVVAVGSAGLIVWTLS